jgi:hypothetical protein
MSVMERSHGRHQRDGGLSGAQGLNGAAQCRNGTDDHGTSRHLGLISGGFWRGEGTAAAKTRRARADLIRPDHCRQGYTGMARLRQLNAKARRARPADSKKLQG